MKFNDEIDKELFNSTNEDLIKLIDDFFGKYTK